MKKLFIFIIPFLYYFLYILYIVLLIGCNEDSSSKTKFLTFKVGISIPNRGIKNLKYSDIDSIKLTILDDEKTYLIDGLLENKFGIWEIVVNDLPVNQTIKFIAEAFDKKQNLILKGDITEKITILTNKITIPLYITQDIEIGVFPIIDKISIGDTNATTKQTTITFNINNSLGGDIHWKITPDSYFLQNRNVKLSSKEGNISFETSQMKSFNIYINGDLGDKIYTFNIDVFNKNGDKFGEEFKVFSKRDEVNIAIAPIVDNIYLYLKNGKLFAKAIINSSLGALYYDWSLEYDSLPLTQNGSEVEIKDFKGNLVDTLILKVTNKENITSQFSYFINLHNIKLAKTEEPINPIDCIDNQPPPTTTTEKPKEEKPIISTSKGSSESEYYFDLKYVKGDSYSKTIDLAFGETAIIEVNASPYFKDSSHEIFGAVNIDYLEFTPYLYTRHIDTTTQTDLYTFKITPKGVLEGTTYFKFFIKNKFRSEYVDFTINSREITKSVNLQEKYVIFKDSKKTLNLMFLNERNHQLSFSLNSNNLKYSNALIVGKNIFDITSNGIDLKIDIQGIKIGNEFLKIHVTDTKLNYSKDFKILLQVEQRSATNLVDDLYECEKGINKNDFESVQDLADNHFTAISNNKVKLSSQNNISNRADLSNVILFINANKLNNATDGIGHFYITQQSYPYKIIAEIKYKEMLEGSDFYVKYYDENLNKVICQKNRFPKLNEEQF